MHDVAPSARNQDNRTFAVFDGNELSLCTCAEATTLTQSDASEKATARVQTSMGATVYQRELPRRVLNITRR
jgi:hypothetical protein